MNSANKPQQLMALDYGTVRIGVAIGDTQVKIAIPSGTVEVDGQEIPVILKLAKQHAIDHIIVGYPRNQSGQATKQTKLAEDFKNQLSEKFEPVSFQDESLTSVLAEGRLKSHNKPYSRGDIDALAAALILEDYFEEHAK